VARSYGLLKSSVWESGSDFRTLGPLAQWAYTMLLSQPQISNLGILPYTPTRWIRLAAGLTLDAFQQALAELAAGRFVIVDEDAGEVLVRTFVKHDKVWAQPRLVANARTLIDSVESRPIYDYLVDRHPWLVQAWDKQQIHDFETPRSTAPETPPDTPSETRLDTPFLKNGSEQRVQDQGVGPGSSSRTNGYLEDARARAEQQEPAAAEDPDLEAPREHDIRHAVEQLRDHDAGSLTQLEPIARQLPAILFRDVVDRTQTRIHTSRVANHTGLFRRLLEVAATEHQRRSEPLREVRDLRSHVEFQARSYARGKHPWDVAADLLERELARLGLDETDRVELLDHAADVYRHETDRAGVPS
jgi:hypothetical protein